VCHPEKRGLEIKLELLLMKERKSALDKRHRDERKAAVPSSAKKLKSRPLDKFPLFTKTQNVLGRLYKTPAYDKNENFPNAYKFYNNAIKLPMWAYEDEEWIVDSYIEGFHRVCNKVLNNSESLIGIGKKNDR